MLFNLKFNKTQLMSALSCEFCYVKTPYAFELYIAVRDKYIPYVIHIYMNVIHMEYKFHSE